MRIKKIIKEQEYQKARNYKKKRPVRYISKASMT